MSDKPKDPAEFSKLSLAAKSAVSTPSVSMQKLLSVGQRIVTTKAWQPSNGKTFCNYAVSSAAKDFGYNGFSVNSQPLMANEIINKMAKDPNWKQATASEAWDWALQGKLAIACYSDVPHGHVAVVAPGPRVWSDKWSGYYPPVFNVGASVNSKAPYTMGENFAFLYRPNHYIYAPVS